MTRKAIKTQASRYTKFVEWSDEDQCFIGRCPELMRGGVHGSDEAAVYAELCDAVEEWIGLLHQELLERFLPVERADDLGAQRLEGLLDQPHDGAIVVGDQDLDRLGLLFHVFLSRGLRQPRLRWILSISHNTLPAAFCDNLVD